jgi:hypothetical protein
MRQVPDTPAKALDGALAVVASALVDHLNEYVGPAGGEWIIQVTVNDGWEEDQAESTYARVQYGTGYSIVGTD